MAQLKDIILSSNDQKYWIKIVGFMLFTDSKAKQHKKFQEINFFMFSGIKWKSSIRVVNVLFIIVL